MPGRHEPLRFASVCGRHHLAEARGRAIFEQARRRLRGRTGSAVSTPGTRAAVCLRHRASASAASSSSPPCDPTGTRLSSTVDATVIAPTAPRSTSEAPFALGPRVIRALRIGKLRRRAADDDGDTALEIDVLEVAVAQLGAHRRRKPANTSGAVKRRAGRKEIGGRADSRVPYSNVVRSRHRARASPTEPGNTAVASTSGTACRIRVCRRRQARGRPGGIVPRHRQPRCHSHASPPRVLPADRWRGTRRDRGSHRRARWFAAG